MRRITLPSRPDWPQKANEIGFTYHSLGKAPEDVNGVYWYEEAAYEFTADEVDRIEAATAELHRMCLAAVDHVVHNPSEMDAFCIPSAYRDIVVRSWKMGQPGVMGRFDLAYDPTSGAIKMLEYNADTPTLVIESALMQWFWLQDVFPGADQFNSLHEKLIEAFADLKRGVYGGVIHFGYLPYMPEEAQHISYFCDLADQAGLRTKKIAMRDIGWDDRKHWFVDTDNEPIRFLHKLYPWEWLIKEPFAQHIPYGSTLFSEPPWKMLLSNKALLPLLWKLYPDHPNLLAASWELDQYAESWIKKPILAREGQNIMIVRDGVTRAQTEGVYGESPCIYQALADIPVFDGQHVVIGSWIAGSKPAGMIIRESESPIVVNTSRVVPHLFR